jgi:hypothetical protein
MEKISILKHLQSGNITQKTLEKDVQSFIKETIKAFSKKWELQLVIFVKEFKWTDRKELMQKVRISWENCEVYDGSFYREDSENSIEVYENKWLTSEHFNDMSEDFKILGINKPKKFIKELLKLLEFIDCWISIFDDQKDYVIKFK